MRPTVVFAWRRYPPPFLIGGAEVSQALLAAQLADAGWNVAYVGSHEPPWGGESLIKEFSNQLRQWSISVEFNASSDTLVYSWRGVRCVSAPQAAIEGWLKKLSAEGCVAVVTSQEGSVELARLGAQQAPVIGWVHSVSDTGQLVLRADPSFALLTSRFVRSRVTLSPGTEPVLFYPPFAPPLPGDRAPTRDILVVNPVPAKGGALIRELAAFRPERTITLVEGWWSTRADFADLENVVYLPRTYDMDSLYKTHRILLVPSVVEDAFPRVIVEAALNGVPAIGSAVGGIGEAIGPGGSVVDSSSPEAWDMAINLLSPPEQLSRYRLAASKHAQQFVRDCTAELVQAGAL